MKWTYGWLYGNVGPIQFVRINFVSDGNRYPWGITRDISKATKFKSKEECESHWRSINAFPEDKEHCIHDGYLHFMDDKGQLQLF